MIRINSSRFCFILSPEAAAFQAGKGQRSSTKEQLPKAILIPSGYWRRIDNKWSSRSRMTFRKS